MGIPLTKSDIRVDAFSEKKSLEMTVRLLVPKSKNTDNQCRWLKKQILNCVNEARAEPLKTPIENILEQQLKIDIYVKSLKTPIRVDFSDIDNVPAILKKKKIDCFELVLVNDNIDCFSEPKKFVATLDAIVADFHQGFVQYLSTSELPSKTQAA